MCGIFGYISNYDLDDNRILKSLSNRGPDNQNVKNVDGFFPEKKCRLFHTRLSIIDTNHRSNQPFIDEGERFSIIYNGEIYNFGAIRKELEKLGYKFRTSSDTEVLLYAYQEWKEKSLNRFRGMFAFAIFDKQEHSVFLARDPFGMKPLYYYYENENFAFSSLLSSIISSGIQKVFTINKTAINDYIYTGSFIPPETIVNEIKMLSPGSFILLKENNISIESFYSIKSAFISDKIGSYQKVITEVRNTVINSVDNHFVADVPVGVLLSGGVDSSLLAGISSEILGKSINTYSIGYKDSKFKKIDETNIASKTAEHLGTIHENILIDYEDFGSQFNEFIEALDVPSVDGFNTFVISKRIAKRVKVVLSGLGGDEMFAGYPIYKTMYYLNNLKAIDRILHYLPHKLLNKLNKGYLSSYGMSPKEVLIRKRLLSREPEWLKNKLNSFLLDKNTDIIDEVTNFEIQHYMSHTLLRDSDAVSMHSGLELRTPFVDREILNLIARIPSRFKISTKYNKPLLVDAFKDVLIPDVYLAKKRGFSLPIATWTSEMFQSKKYRLLENDSFYIATGISRGVINMHFINGVDNSKKYLFGVLIMWLEKNQAYLNI